MLLYLYIFLLVAVLQRGPVSFFLDNLQSGSFYRIIIFSVNIKGRSEPLIIDDVQVKDAAKLTGKYILQPSEPISSVIYYQVLFPKERRRVSAKLFSKRIFLRLI